MPKHKPNQKPNPVKPDKVKFVYEKARHHRTFHADGAWATPTPQGEVQFTFFNDLRPMPEWTESALTDKGVVGAELSRRHDTQNITREANVTVVMNKVTVESLITLLSTIVGHMKRNEETASAVAVKTQTPSEAGAIQTDGEETKVS